MDEPLPPAPIPSSRLLPKRVVYRWDLDKTYLRTEFDTVRDLLRTAFEPAARKRTVPGAASLLREIRATEPAGIFILSGSPEQMRRVLEAKLRLDGIRWDSFTLKPSLRNILRGRFRFVKDQIGYKLAALLSSRASMDGNISEVLFGDDAEADAFIYSLYADICAGRVSTEMLLEVLERARVYPDDIPALVSAAGRVPRADTVRQVFIHLDRVSAVSVFEEFGRRVCPFHNYFQPALVLLQRGALSPAATLRVGIDMLQTHSFGTDTLTASLMDMVRGGFAGKRCAQQLLTELTEGDQAAGAGEGRVWPQKAAMKNFRDAIEERLDRIDEVSNDPAKEIDYAGLFTRDKDRARRARSRAKGRKRRWH